MCKIHSQKETPVAVISHHQGSSTLSRNFLACESNSLGKTRVMLLPGPRSGKILRLLLLPHSEKEGKNLQEAEWMTWKISPMKCKTLK
jgi:hypothetical protein